MQNSQGASFDPYMLVKCLHFAILAEIYLFNTFAAAAAAADADGDSSYGLAYPLKAIPAQLSEQGLYRQAAAGQQQSQSLRTD